MLDMAKKCYDAHREANSGFTDPPIPSLEELKNEEDLFIRVQRRVSIPKTKQTVPESNVRERIHA